ncbi:hypothetical protein AB205_0084180 [Aquarana catesbeiana]|uniref:Uncharacterized protein n=1 Tax=Aquarana catesbeiana TaxID=8400 RepID=A0A2G9RJE1_AQUCT|nr:hypothetical protein AB205_0084180 [Aquarana catesbeiana]
MVLILEKQDYDCKLCNYERPNSQKDSILEKVIAVLQGDFSVQQTEDQIIKRWSDLKHSDQDQMESIHKIIKKRRHQKMRLQPSHQKWRREATLARAPTGEATRPSSHQKCDNFKHSFSHRQG